MRLLVTRCLKKHIKCGSASFTDLIHYGAFSLPSFFFMDELSMLIFTERKPFHSDSVWTSLTLNFTVCVCVCVFTGSSPGLAVGSELHWVNSPGVFLPVRPVPSRCLCPPRWTHTHTSSSTLPSAIFGGGYKYLWTHLCVCVCVLLKNLSAYHFHSD